jgi:hypothetical protein
MDVGEYQGEYQLAQAGGDALRYQGKKEGLAIGGKALDKKHENHHDANEVELAYLPSRHVVDYAFNRYGEEGRDSGIRPRAQKAENEGPAVGS